MKASEKCGAISYLEGKNQKPAESLVPGDIVALAAGELVPADCRIIQSQELGVDESPLTGESIPVNKVPERMNEEKKVADRNNMIYKGTAITSGTGKGVVTGTAMNTEIGHISSMVNETKKLIWLVLALAAAFFLFGWISGKDLYQLFQTSIAWTIAAIPEGLPVVASIALARGMLRLAKQNVIVKKLSAVETLGETTIIFTDKTGTLTENNLTVNKLVWPGFSICHGN